jgi:hypothetical protein
MQDVDRPPYVQLAQPPRDRGPRVQVKPVRLVPRSKDRKGIAGRLGGRRHFGKSSAVRAAEPELAVRLPIELVALLADGAARWDVPAGTRAPSSRTDWPDASGSAKPLAST